MAKIKDNGTSIPTPERISFMAGKINEIVDRIDTEINVFENTGDLLHLLAYFKQVDDAYDELDKARKLVGALIERMSRNVIPDLMRAAGASTVTLDELGYRFTISSRIYASIIADKKEEAYEWLRSQGLGDLIQPTVNSSSLSALAKNLIEQEGQDLPEDLFKISPMTTTSATAVRKKG